jgi:hypothetical protein
MELSHRSSIFYDSNGLVDDVTNSNEQFWLLRDAWLVIAKTQNISSSKSSPLSTVVLKCTIKDEQDGVWDCDFTYAHLRSLQFACLIVPSSSPVPFPSFQVCALTLSRPPVPNLLPVAMPAVWSKYGCYSMLLLSTTVPLLAIYITLSTQCRVIHFLEFSLLLQYVHQCQTDVDCIQNARAALKHSPFLALSLHEECLVSRNRTCCSLLSIFQEVLTMID